MQMSPGHDDGGGRGCLPPPLPSRVALAGSPTDRRLVRFRVLLSLGACVAVVLGLWLVHRFDPARHSFYPRCWFHDVTGWHCPGCGTLRGLHALAQGDFGGAVRRNALVFAVVPATLLAGGFLACRRSGRLCRLTSAAWIGWTTLIVILIFGILRNLPFRPFSMLAP